jgi:EAL domain-containing protein (putative c-di-GMP-specific phosphodiesterase class I)/CheY-like chemotaxis protein
MPVAQERILVVDDEPALRSIASEVLSGAGYLVSACSNGHEALETLQRATYDAVLSDVRMPDMDGLGLLRAVRERDLDVPVVLWTGGPSVETAAEAVEYGALQYLIKPVPSEKLLEAVSRAVKLGSLARLKREALRATGFDQLVGDRAGLEAAFGRAMNAVSMAYQPIVRAADGRLYAHEALLRTAEPLFPNPPALLNAAERLGRLPDLGAAIRGSVAEGLASGALPGEVFVNLHPHDLADPRLLDPRAPLSRLAARVVLEVTERVSLEGVPDLPDRLRALRAMGYRIAIDDLGAGYAGLTSFAALGPEIVKIDMALVRGIDRDVVKQKLVGSITSLCQDLGILVVAEGVETKGEREAAVRAGCDLLQGFLLGRPSLLARA